MKTYADLERDAYITGRIQLASIYANLDDKESEIDGFDALLEAATDRGRADARDEEINQARANVESLQKQLNSAMFALKSVVEHLGSDQFKTVVGRKEFAKWLRNYSGAHALFY